MGDSVQLNDVKGDYQNVNKEVEYDTLNSNLVELNDYAILNTKTKPSSDRHKDESKPNLADSPVLWRRRNIYGWVLVIILISTATLIVCIYIFMQNSDATNKLQDCQAVKITNGVVRPDTNVSHGSTVAVECKDQYSVIGNPKPRCNNGTFENIPLCVKVPGCPSDWKRHGISCYYFGEYSLGWIEAALKCRAEGGYLAEIESLTENEYLVSEASKQGGVHWIGGTDAFTEGVWVWVKSMKKIDGYTGWGPGQPDNTRNTEHCLEVNYRPPGTWNDRPCYIQQKYICEIYLPV